MLDFPAYRYFHVIRDVFDVEMPAYSTSIDLLLHSIPPCSHYHNLDIDPSHLDCYKGQKDYRYVNPHLLPPSDTLSTPI